MKSLFILAVAAFLGLHCAPEPTTEPATSSEGGSSIPSYPVDDGFGDYWYQGRAEITSYKLDQPRYGQVREGSSVLIFVTEDFSRSKHVKLDRPAEAGNDGVTVLKLNRTRNFTTGIYPYSMMASVFTPISGDRDPRSLKSTVSSQEWCGHTFSQLDLEGDTYRVQHYSYFESDSDRTVYLSDAVLEDEIWTKIRIDPSSLPTGTVRMIAGALHQRLSHEDYSVSQAFATIAPGDSTDICLLSGIRGYRSDTGYSF